MAWYVRTTQKVPQVLRKAVGAAQKATSLEICSNTRPLMTTGAINVKSHSITYGFAKSQVPL